MKNLRAFTLVEMLACISVGSVLMGVALSMVHRTMHADTTARSYAQVERTATLLSRQFRHDIHRAKTFSLEDRLPEATKVRITLPEESDVIYRLVKNSICREQQQISGKTHRETFGFPDNFSLQVNELSDPPRVELTLKQELNLIEVSPRVKLHVEAVEGQLLRLSRSQGISK